MTEEFIRLDGRESTLLLRSRAGRQFELAYWGDRLPPDASPDAVYAVVDRPLPHGVLDQEEPLVLLPETGLGFVGTPGIELHCAGKDSITDLRLAEFVASDSEATLLHRDERLGLVVETRIEIDVATDVVSMRSRLHNEGERVLDLQWLAAAVLSVPSRCDELLAFAGRWCREFHETRQRLGVGKWSTENRTGRTSHHSFPGVVLGTSGFSADCGEVFGLHLGWSGNHRVFVERLRDGRLQCQLGELLLPGEVRLEPGAEYASPTAYAVRSMHGLNGMSQAFHEFVRSRVLPSNARRPRPVTFSTWEAVYFDHDQARLEQLVDTAAALGVERFVLDDGWFRGREHDRAGLGDWEPCPRRYPEGLQPIATRVRSHGMQFGLWIEPEMVNADSDLYRAHPGWIMGLPDREQPLGRHQYLLDLGRDEVQEHLFRVIDELVSSLRIDFLKWDMNRDMTHAVSADGRAVAGRHVRALYALIDRLRERHPSLEIEGCASGGARADYGLLSRVERIWTSDSNDPLERQVIQRGFMLFFPPEVMGAHVGPAISHTTGRQAALAMRAGTAFPGHLGLELDPESLSSDERVQLTQWLERYRDDRTWLHDGRLYRLDHPDATLVAWLAVSRDGARALVSAAKVATSADSVPVPLRLSGLESDAYYRVERRIGWAGHGAGVKRSTDLLDGLPVEVPGAVLLSAGLALPLLPPGSLCFFTITRLRTEP